jgi:hypothetical protein
MNRSHWTLAESVSPRTTARIMGSPSIDEVLGRAAPPRDRSGTDLPSVIARIGRKLAHIEDDHGTVHGDGSRVRSLHTDISAHLRKL